MTTVVEQEPLASLGSHKKSLKVSTNNCFVFAKIGFLLCLAVQFNFPALNTLCPRNSNQGNRSNFSPGAMGKFGKCALASSNRTARKGLM